MDFRSFSFQHAAIEAKWIDTWDQFDLYSNSIFKDSHSDKKPFDKVQGIPFYNLMMFPYPSAEGLHIGNMYAFTGSDIYGRYKRMQGFTVFEPIGLDGFGIHSENYALKIGKHPMNHAKVTEKKFYNQLHRIGAMFDWTRTVETYDPAYYKWTQWIFVQMFKHGLAYRGKANVNWCLGCKTVLADEQVVAKKATISSSLSDPELAQGESKDPRRTTADSGQEVIVDVCERCGNKVEKRLLEQWFFRITAYAEKLLQNIVGSGKTGVNLDWSEKIRVAQQNWIGKKEGVNITYPVTAKDGQRVGEITCFTTRPDTNFGATFVAISPEHPFVDRLLSFRPPPTGGEPESAFKGTRILKPFGLAQGGHVWDDDLLEKIRIYVERSKNTKKEDCVVAGGKKTGVFTGLYCLNQLNNNKMPLYISDFVLKGFGTGAVVGVPGHDTRDFEFAQTFDVPVIRVVAGKDQDEGPITTIEQVQEDEGTMIHSDFLNGKDIHEAAKIIMDYMVEKGWGRKVATYHLRDWLISRQRYWGPPIPMIYCAICASQGRSWFTTPEAQSLMGNPKSQIPMTKPSFAKASKGRQVQKTNPKASLDIGHWTLDIPAAAGWYTVSEDQLPVILPRIEDYKPGDDGIAPLAKHKEFYETACPGCGGKAVRETDVSDTFLDSSWYFLRYPSVGIDKKTVRQEDGKIEKDSVFQRSESSSEASLPAKRVLLSQSLPWDPEITKHWLPVHMYTGGAEHSVLHLMYSRFVTMALHDFGYLDFEEPFRRFYAHGLVIKDGVKMSKSKGNVINPDTYIDRYGADAVRLYLMFMGPFDQGGDFRDSAMEGMSRWVGRVWRLVHTIAGKQSQSSSAAIQSALQNLIIKVTEDMEKRRYNTAIALMMEFTNLVSDEGGMLSPDDVKIFLRLLAPMAPFITEELWYQLHNAKAPEAGKTNSEIMKRYTSIHLQSWPIADQSKVQEQAAVIVVQVNGKVRDTLSIDKKVSQKQSEVEIIAKKSPKAEKFLAGKTIKRVIFVPGKLINFVVS